ncbi:uncharacterized protein LOC127845559 [Dreissena polymorpha]|uniref:Uncharacterized protein n=1 Tax=Dreissena polymorpha TaxID=45954 RepID=A0A9D4EIX1_DREPO|nr:uncharacterized protein LOC127845559 [Dreissena polymorpha]KAH3778905.1 hypothetical protein DPMN_180382 [Dreissena polymorpha]
MVFAILIIFGVVGNAVTLDCPQCQHSVGVSNQPPNHDEDYLVEKVKNFDCAENKIRATACPIGIERCYSVHTISNGKGLTDNPEVEYTIELVQRGCAKLVISSVPGICENSKNATGNNFIAALQSGMSMYSSAQVTGEVCDGSKSFQIQIHEKDVIAYRGAGGKTGRNSAVKGVLDCAWVILIFFAL